MFWVVLEVLVPIALACIASVVFTKPAKVLAEFKKTADRTRRVVAILLLVLGSIAAVLLDVLDVSDLLFHEGAREEQRVNGIVADLKSLYDIPEEKIESLKARIVDISSVNPNYNVASIHVVAISLGVSVALYILLLAYSSSSEGILASEIADSKSKYAEAKESSSRYEKLWQTACEALTQVETIVGVKLTRIQRASHEDLASENPETRLECFRRAMSPDEQFQAIVDATHYFYYDGVVDVRVRVALFLPDANKEFLYVQASTDGRGPGVVTSPNNTECKEMYKISLPMPRSIAALAYQQEKPVIISDTSQDKRFTFFKETQKNQIKSMFACPLSYGPDRVIGVLVADSNKTGYFSDDIYLQFMLEIMSIQVALRVKFEKCMVQFCGCLADGVAKSTKGVGDHG